MVAPASSSNPHRTVYILGHNLPGYMPESDNYIVATQRDATRSNWADATADRDAYRESAVRYSSADVHLSGRHGDYWLSGADVPGGVHYWSHPVVAELVAVTHVRCANCGAGVGNYADAGNQIGVVAESCWYVADADCYVCCECVPARPR